MHDQIIGITFTKAASQEMFKSGHMEHTPEDYKFLRDLLESHDMLEVAKTRMVTIDFDSGNYIVS